VRSVHNCFASSAPAQRAGSRRNVGTAAECEKIFVTEGDGMGLGSDGADADENGFVVETMVALRVV